MARDHDRLDDALLQEMREGGGTERLGALLEEHRAWLHLLARLELDRSLGVKVDASDVVQETFLQATRDRGSFRGRTRGELASWLRSILAHGIAYQVRRYRAGKRDIDLEVTIDQRLGASSRNLAASIADSATSPSGLASRSEDAIALADALAGVSDEYREVIILRALQELSHEEIARRMNRSEGAVRMLWLRALAELRRVMGDRQP